MGDKPTKTEQELIDKVPLLGTSLIDMYKWLTHNHFVIRECKIDKEAHEIIFSFAYDRKRYWGYTFVLRIRAKQTVSNLKHLKENIEYYFHTFKEYDTSPILFQRYSAELEENKIAFYGCELTTASGYSVFLG